MDEMARGLELIPTYCLTCHGVGEREMEEMLAPPLLGVRAHYLAQYPEAEDFVAAMTAFVLEPRAEQSLMPLALEKYGLKPMLSLSEAEIRSVAWAIYAGQVERPTWMHDYRKVHRACKAVW